VCELTGGNSLAANIIQLVLNNAALGARIAASL
jgi:pseudouridine-5'-phosphate glycosidase